MPSISNRHANNNPLRKARQHHKYLRSKDPSLAPAVASSGMVLPTGEVALPLTDGDVAVYGVASTVTYRWQLVWLVQSPGGLVIDLALNGIADFDRCVRAAAAKSSLNIIPLAAE
jgi:hypothetical protein